MSMPAWALEELKRNPLTDKDVKKIIEIVCEAKRLYQEEKRVYG